MVLRKTNSQDGTDGRLISRPAEGSGDVGAVSDFPESETPGERDERIG